jgi:cellulose synthase operon protein YhjU
MEFWIFYFFAKIYLYYKGILRLDVLLNLLFLSFLMISIPKRFKFIKSFTIVKFILSAIFGVLLLCHDSLMPGPLGDLNLVKQHGMPSQQYVYHYLLGFYNPKEFGILTFILSICILLRKYSKIMAAGTSLLLIFPLFISSGNVNYQSTTELEKNLGSFYNAEATRLIHFKPPKNDNSDFDIIILHVCSLSWDDLRDLNMEGDQFFKQFDYLLTNFNSATTYSNPAVIRLLHANCGQCRHDDLYNEIPRECSLVESLSAQGYEIQFARNHNGIYDKFDEEVKRFGHLDASPFLLTNLTAKSSMFDDSPVYDDYSVLEHWLAARQKLGSKKVTLYYNTVSLHDGTHQVADKYWWAKDSLQQYKESVHDLLDDMTKFFNLVAESGRETIIIFIGEHGRSVHGSAIGPPGLRDIPLPRITTVPVGIKFIGKKKSADQTGRQVIISRPMSYFALSYMLAAFTEQSPFTSARYWTNNFIDNIPQTDFVAENFGNIVFKKGGYYYLYRDKKWIPLSENELK